MSKVGANGNGGFDPARFLRKIKVGGKNSAATADYLEVKYRVMWVRAEHPDAHMESEMVHFGDGVAVVRVLVTLSNGAEAVGHGSCELSDPDAVEKAETAGLGRALAVLGYGTQFALLDEARVVDAPAGRPAADGALAAAAQVVDGVPAEPAADLVPADPRAVPAWFRRRVLTMAELGADEEQVKKVAAALADALRDRGLSTRQRGWLYLALTGKSSGTAMDPRELALLVHLVSRAELLKQVADEYGAAEAGTPAAGRNGRGAR